MMYEMMLDYINTKTKKEFLVVLELSRIYATK